MIDILSILIVIVLTFIGTSLVPSLLATNIVPMLSLFFIIGLTYFQRGVGPVLIAALAGLLLDFLSGSVFGLHLGLFLMVAVIIRFLFQEGMKEMSIGHYLAIVVTALLLYFGAEGLILYFEHASLVFGSFVKPFLIFLGVNLTFALLMYLFNLKYFEGLQKLESYQRTR